MAAAIRICNWHTGWEGERGCKLALDGQARMGSGLQDAHCHPACLEHRSDRCLLTLPHMPIEARSLGVEAMCSRLATALPVLGRRLAPCMMCSKPQLTRPCYLCELSLRHTSLTALLDAQAAEPHCRPSAVMCCIPARPASATTCPIQVRGLHRRSARCGAGALLTPREQQP